MSRIALIDTNIDIKYIKKVKSFESISLCSNSIESSDRDVLSHGTSMAMVLDHCADNYELINIQIFSSRETRNRQKPICNIEILAEALRLCTKLNIDIVSLSAVSSNLYDSKLIYHVTKELSRKTIIVAALDNFRYITVPSSYPFVLGVQSDRTGILNPGEIAFRPNDPYGAEIYANCAFDFLTKYDLPNSNSLAVPVAVSFINNILNKEKKTLSQICSMIKRHIRFQISEKDESIYYPNEPVLPCEKYQTDDGAPLILIGAEYSENLINKCRILMDILYEKKNVKSAGLTFINGTYDIRLKNIGNMDMLDNDILFMQRHYKADIIFILAELDKIHDIHTLAEVDIEIEIYKDIAALKYDGTYKEIRTEHLPDFIFTLLTGE